MDDSKISLLSICVPCVYILILYDSKNSTWRYISLNCKGCDSVCFKKENLLVLINFSCKQCKFQGQWKTCKLYLPHLPQFLSPGNPPPMQMVQCKVIDCSAPKCPREKNRYARARPAPTPPEKCRSAGSCYKPVSSTLIG